MQKINIDIIHKKINGRTNSDEEIVFEKWINASEKNRLYYERVKMYSQKSVEEIQSEPIPDTSAELFSKINKRTRMRLVYNIMQYAAALIIPMLVLGGIVLYTDTTPENHFAQNKSQTIVTPKRNQATLITSSGESIELGTPSKKSIKIEKGVEINREQKDGLKYIKDKNIKSEQIVYNTLKTPIGGDFQIELSDGTKVWLNSASELRYPVNFGDRDREVEIKGEAYFDVSKTGKRFIVHTNGMAVEVLGTKFNIMAYDGEKAIETTLVSGKVKVNTDKNKANSVFLTPGKQASCNRENGNITKKSVDTRLYTGWIDGYYRFEDKRLEDILRYISHWYNIDIEYRNSETKNITLSGKLHKFDDFNIIAEMIEKISDVKINVKGCKVKVSKRN